MEIKSLKAASASEYFGQYRKNLSETLDKVDGSKIDSALSILLKAIESGAQVFVAGNGGSAAIANHLCCDWTKGTFARGQKPLMTHSLSANTSMLTAVANDLGFEQSFSAQLEMMGKADDVLVLISSSGNSPNILRAAEMAREMKITVIGLTGFSGGKLQQASDVAIHVPIANYGIVEDAHQMIMHTLAQFLTEKRKI